MFTLEPNMPPGTQPAPCVRGMRSLGNNSPWRRWCGAPRQSCPGRGAACRRAAPRLAAAVSGRLREVGNLSGSLLKLHCQQLAANPTTCCRRVRSPLTFSLAELCFLSTAASCTGEERVKHG